MLRDAEDLVSLKLHSHVLYVEAFALLYCEHEISFMLHHSAVHIRVNYGVAIANEEPHPGGLVEGERERNGSFPRRRISCCERT